MCILAIGTSAATFLPDDDGMYEVSLDMTPNSEYIMFVLKGTYDQTNYVEAYNSLVLSADETIIYNPTLIDVWMDVDGKVYKVASGETIKL